MVVTGSMSHYFSWKSSILRQSLGLATSLRGCYRFYRLQCIWLLRFYTVVTGSMYHSFPRKSSILWSWQGLWLYVAVTDSVWLLRVLCGCYKLYVVVTGSMPHSFPPPKKKKIVVITGSMTLGGCYRFYMAVMGYMWLLRGLCPMLFRKNPLAWLLWVLCGCYVIHHSRSLTWWARQRTWSAGCWPAPGRWPAASSGPQRSGTSASWHTPSDPAGSWSLQSVGQ